MNESNGNGNSRERSDPLAELVRVGGRRALPPRADYDAVLAAASASWQIAVSARKRRRWMGALAASVVLAAVCLAALHYRSLAPGTKPMALANLVQGDLMIEMPGTIDWRPLERGAAIYNGARLRASGPAGAALSLSAGGSVRLRASTEFALSSGAHLQIFNGSVYVDTDARASAEPIVMQTPLGTVRDIGTVFEVRASSGALRVRVRAGRVLIDSAAHGGSLEGQAGQELQLQTDGTTRRSSISAANPEWDWAEALAIAPIVDGRPLLGFLEWVAHETGRGLQFQSDGDRVRAAAVLLHGRVPDLRPLDALEVMLTATDFEYSLSDAGAIVIHRRVL